MTQIPYRLKRHRTLHGPEPDNRARWEGRVSLIISMISLVSIVFTYMQVRYAEDSIRLVSHGQLIASSLEYDKLVAGNADLRPYFRDGQKIDRNANLTNYNKAAALADLLLDVIDGNIEYTLTVSDPAHVKAWLMTFDQSFKNSPILCEVFKAHAGEYSEELQRVGNKNC